VNTSDDGSDGDSGMCGATAPALQRFPHRERVGASLGLVPALDLEMRRMFVVERHRSSRRRDGSSAGAVVHHWNCNVSRHRLHPSRPGMAATVRLW